MAIKKDKKKSQESHSKEEKKNPRNRQEKLQRLVYPIILCFSWIVFARGIFNGWTNWDDPLYVLENDLIKNLSFEKIQYLFTHFYIGNYHPLTLLVYAIDYSIGGLDSSIYHASSLLFHTINVILLYYIILKINNQQRMAFIAAILFALHPTQVETVAWASGLKDALLTTFYFAGIRMYLNYVESSKKIRYYIAVTILFILSLLCKATAVTFPIALLAFDFLLNRELKWKLVIEKIPLIILSLVFGILSIEAQKSYKAIMDSSTFPIFDRIFFVSSNLFTYTLKSVFPFQMSAFYPYPEKLNGIYPVEIYFTILFVPVMVYYLFLSLKHSKVYVFGGLFFLITILPVLQILPVGDAIRADRYSYLPMAGLCYILGYFITSVWDQTTPFKLLLKPMVFSVLVGWMMYIGYEGFKRNQVWKNSYTLWTDVIKKYPKVPHAYNNLGHDYFKSNQNERALDNYNLALTCNPNFVDALLNRGAVYTELGNFDSAITDYNKAIRLVKDNPTAFYNRGIAFAALDSFLLAIQDYSEALKLKPRYIGAHMNRGVVYAKTGQTEAAFKDFFAVIKLSPNNVEALGNLGNLYDMTDQNEMAIKYYSKVISFNPTSANAYFNRGRVRLKSKKYGEAIADFSKAIETQKGNGAAYLFRSYSLNSLERFQEALDDLVSAERFGVQIDMKYLAELRNKAGSTN